MGETHERIAAAAGRLLAATAATKSIEPFTDADPEFSLDAAHAVADEILKRRVERGERVVGWKIGFTNRNIWEEYGVHAPIWGLPAEAHANWLKRLNQLIASMPSTQFLDLCEVAQPDAFKGHPELMHDFNHLNEAGARLFSSMLAERLKAELKQSSAASVSQSPAAVQAAPVAE